MPGVPIADPARERSGGFRALATGPSASAPATAARLVAPGDYATIYTMDLVGNRRTKEIGNHDDGHPDGAADEAISYDEYDANDRLLIGVGIAPAALGREHLERKVSGGVLLRRAAAALMVAAIALYKA